jgi:hypothetical protein
VLFQALMTLARLAMERCRRAAMAVEEGNLLLLLLLFKALSPHSPYCSGHTHSAHNHSHMLVLGHCGIVRLLEMEEEPKLRASRTGMKFIFGIILTYLLLASEHCKTAT